MSATPLVQFVDCGLFNDIETDIEPSSGANFTVTFNIPFPRAPQVVVTPYYTSASPAWVANFSLGVVSVSTTQCVVRIMNNGSTAHHIGAFRWIAVLPST